MVKVGASLRELLLLKLPIDLSTVVQPTFGGCDLDGDADGEIVKVVE